MFAVRMIVLVGVNDPVEMPVLVSVFLAHAARFGAQSRKALPGEYERDAQGGRFLNPAITALLLLVAAILEVGGDAIVRVGLRSPGGAGRLAAFALGAAVLFGYGIFVNTAPADFGRLLGIYVVMFFVVAQIVNRVAFGMAPSLPILVGGAFVVAGGAIMTLWRT